MSEVRRALKLDDFGNEYFREPLQVALECCHNEAELTWVGRLNMRRAFQMGLINRLEQQAAIKRPSHAKRMLRNLRNRLLLRSRNGVSCQDPVLQKRILASYAAANTRPFGENVTDSTSNPEELPSVQRTSATSSPVLASRMAIRP